MISKGNKMYVLASFIAAFAVGYSVQNGDENPIFANSSEDSDVELVDPETVLLASAPTEWQLILPRAPRETINTNQLSLPLLTPSTRMRESLESNPTLNGQKYSAYGVPCLTTLSTTASSAAMISVEISASCEPNQRFLLKQGNLKITSQTSAVGFAKMSIPALSLRPEITVLFDDGQFAKSNVAVPEFAGYERVALQWQGQSGLAIHALEFGADYGRVGHVWREDPRSVDHAESAFGGFITRLGGVDHPAAMHAEIYSFPSGATRRDGAIRLSVEAEITSFNCGKEVLAQTLQPKVASGAEMVDLKLRMPECDAVGDFLVLNNLLSDLKIAQN